MTAGDQKQSKKEIKDQKRVASGKSQTQQPAARANQQKQQKLVQKLEDQIEQVEARLAQITSDLELPETWSDASRSAALNQEMVAGRQRLTELTQEWELEAAKLEEAAS